MVRTKFIKNKKATPNDRSPLNFQRLIAITTHPCAPCHLRNSLIHRREISNRDTRSTSAGLLQLPRVHTELARRYFTYRATEQWNKSSKCWSSESPIVQVTVCDAVWVPLTITFMWTLCYLLFFSHGQSFVWTVSEMSHAVNRGLKSHIMETVCQYKYKYK